MVARDSAVKYLAHNQRGVTRLVVAHSLPLMLAGVTGTLAEFDGIEVVGQTNSSLDVLELVKLEKPDLALLDVGMMALDDFSCVRTLRGDFPGTRVAILSSGTDATELRTAFSEGASAVILTTIATADLGAAIERAANETVFLPFGPTSPPPAALSQAALTAREAEVLRALSNGVSNREIARDLTLSERTVKYHLSNVYRKLGVRGRTDAVRWTFERRVYGRQLGQDRSAGAEGNS